jgi:hypothetical protein
MANNSQWYMATVVPEFGQFRLDDLCPHKIALATRKTLRLLTSAGVTVAVGATDFSINIDEPGATPYLQLHYTFFTPSKTGWSCPLLRQAMNPTGKVKRPVQMKSFDGDNAALAYAVKDVFKVREGDLQTAQSRRDGRSCRNTRNRPLRGQKLLSMMLLLDRIGLQSRLALLGVKRIRQDGMLTMRMLE